MTNPLHSKHNSDSERAAENRHYRAEGCALLVGHALMAYARSDVCDWLADRLNAENPTPAALPARVLTLLMEHPAPGIFMPRPGLRGARP